MTIIPHFSAEGLSNVYVVVDDAGNGLIVDPANVDTELLGILEKECSTLAGVLITHSHQSHIAGLGILMKIYSPAVYAFAPSVNRISTVQFRDGETKRIGNMDVTALHVPGHSMDSLVYAIESAIFTGDTLLSGTIAATGSHVEKELLVKSLETKIMTMEDNTLIYPGHGPISKIRTEKMLNQDMLEAESLKIGRTYQMHAGSALEDLR